MSGGWGTPIWQGGEVAPGETFVSDKSQQMARDLLAAADELGMDPITVRTTNAGFIVPEAVWDQAQVIRADREDRAF